MITKPYLQAHPDHIFVFGDNWQRIGKGGAAVLRDEPNTYGFITKKYPDNEDGSSFTIEEYGPIFMMEMHLLMNRIQHQPENTFLISKIGSGLANKNGIYEYWIEPFLQKLRIYGNVVLLE